MIHTIKFFCYPIYDDINLIKETFKTVVQKTMQDGRQMKLFIYHLEAKGIHFEYVTGEVNTLFITVNPSIILDKPLINTEDCETFIEEFKKRFYSLGFKYTNPFQSLSRIDYKIDFVTENKELYIKLMKKCRTKFRHNKQFNRYQTSIYYNGKSYCVNIYDKEEERNSKGLPVEGFENLLRVEVQIKRPKIKAILKKDGLCDDLMNYWNEIDRDYLMNDILKDIIYNGDYYNLYHSEKILRERYHNKQSTVDNLINLQKLISVKGITEAKALCGYGEKTFDRHLELLQEAGVNPIPIPKNAGRTHLPNLLNFTDSNIYLIENWTSLKASNQRIKEEQTNEKC